MKNKILLILMAAGIMMSGCASDDAPTGYGNPDVPELKKYSLSRGEIEAEAAVRDFNFELIRTIAENDAEILGEYSGGNFMVSPLSATVSLAMAAQSLDDHMESSICDLLGTKDLASLNSLCDKYLRMAAHTGDVFILANSIWCSDALQISPDYVTSMKSQFYADVNTFDKRSGQIADRIDSWASDITGGRISHIADRRDAESQDVFWVNAMTFQGQWRSKFDKNKTSTTIFHGRDKESPVPMMHARLTAEVFGCNGLDGLRLPFKGSTVMTLITSSPTRNMDIAAMAKTLTSDVWQSILRSASDADVDLTLPLIASRCDCDLEAVFTHMGLSHGEYSLEKMGSSNRQNRFMCNQSNYLTIDEEGATAVSVTNTNSGLDTSPGRMDMVFDRPFLYILTDDRTGAILMAGAISNL